MVLGLQVLQEVLVDQVVQVQMEMQERQEILEVQVVQAQQVTLVVQEEQVMQLQ